MWKFQQLYVCNFDHLLDQISLRHFRAVQQTLLSHCATIRLSTSARLKHIKQHEWLRNHDLHTFFARSKVHAKHTHDHFCWVNEWRTDDLICAVWPFWKTLLQHGWFTTLCSKSANTWVEPKHLKYNGTKILKTFTNILRENSSNPIVLRPGGVVIRLCSNRPPCMATQALMKIHHHKQVVTKITWLCQGCGEQTTHSTAKKSQVSPCPKKIKMGSVRQVTTINPPAPKMPSKVVYGYLSYIGTSTAPVVTLGGETQQAPNHKCTMPQSKTKNTATQT